MGFDIFIFGAVMLVAGLIAWFLFNPKQAAQQMVPTVQPQPMQPMVRYAESVGDPELDRKLVRVREALRRKYEAKADAAAIAEAAELLGEE